MSILSGEEQFFKKVEKYKQQEKDAPTLKRAKKPRRKLKNVQQKSYDAQRQGIDTTRVPQRPGTQGHHLASLHSASPFFEGLDVSEKAIMGQKFAQYGLIPGDLSMNRLDMFARLHQGGIHAIEGKNILNLAGKQYFKPGSSFQAKLDAVEQFAADQKLLANTAKRMQYNAEFTTSGLTERVEATATPERSAEYHAKDLQRREQMWRDFAEYGPEQHEVATALGPQMQSDNLAREKALAAYWNSDGSFDIERLKADTASGKFVLPKSGRATPIANRRGSKVKLKVKGGVAQVLSVPFVGGVVAGALTLAEGGTPAQALESAVEAENPIENLMAGPIYNEDEHGLDYGAYLKKQQEFSEKPLNERLMSGAVGDAYRAQQRGSRVVIDAGVVKIPVPEFGLSEFFGFN